MWSLSVFTGIPNRCLFKTYNSLPLQNLLALIEGLKLCLQIRPDYLILKWTAHREETSYKYTIKKKKKRGRETHQLLRQSDSLMVWLQFPVCGSSFCSKLTNQVTNVYELPTNDWVSGTCICIFLTLCFLERDMSLVAPFSIGNSSPTQILLSVLHWGWCLS